MEQYDLHLVWYCAKTDQIFQSGMLEGLFCALAFRPGFWKDHSHIELLGMIGPEPKRRRHGKI